MRRGRFITIEGTDGAGKTTQIEQVRGYLAKRGIPCILTREPGGTPLGEAIRELLLGRVDLDASPRAQLLLVFAARAQHIEEVIEPALARGEWVVCDRFTDATYAYQGGAGELGFESVGAIENWVQGSLRPDLTLLFDVPLDVGLARVRHRGHDGDRFERFERSGKQRVRDAYLRLAKLYPERIEVVDATGEVEEVGARAVKVLEARISAWGND